MHRDAVLTAKQVESAFGAATWLDVMSDISKDYQEIQDELGCGDTAAAILVLAEAIRSSGTFSRSNAENFGHELALALKNVLQESQIRITRR